MTIDHYIEHEDGSIEAVDLMTWARWFETHDRHVVNDILPDGVRVSTVFLGLDHSFSLNGLPILFETIIFGGSHDQYMDRYHTRDEAIAGHAKAVAIAKGELEEA